MLFPPIRLKLLLTGIELRIFNHLSDPISARDVSKAIATHPRNTKFFLDGLAAIGLVKKRNGLYKNTPIGTNLFGRRSPDIRRTTADLRGEIEFRVGEPNEFG